MVFEVYHMHAVNKGENAQARKSELMTFDKLQIDLTSGLLFRRATDPMPLEVT